MKLEFVTTNIRELSLVNNINEDIQLEIQTKSEYTVYYSDDEKSCMCVLRIELSPVDNPEQFKIIYRSNSIFKLFETTLDETVKRAIHVETFNRLYPMCSAQIKNFASMVGLPDMPVAPIDINESEININE